ncbi:MAG: LutC/YkgG family protein [Methylocystaceae bacterium]
MSREQILGRLQSASWSKGQLPSGVIGLSQPQGGDVEQFISKAQAAGAQVERAVDIEAARGILTSIIKEQQVSRVVGTDDLATQGLALPELASELGFAYQVCSQLKGSEYRDYVTNAELGISGCTQGVAETGTLLLSHSHNNERLVSHAPDHYVGVITPEQILADRFSLSSIIQQEQSPPAAWTLVTGVSRTADVALQVVLGMHGPRKVTIIIVG